MAKKKAPPAAPDDNGGENQENNGGENQENNGKEDPGGKDGRIFIPPLNFARVRIRVEGTTPLICHALSEKYRKEMEVARQTDQELEEKTSPGGKGEKKREVRDFDREFRASLYPIEDGYGFPAIAFKRAIVGACRLVSKLDMVTANMIIFVEATHFCGSIGCVKIIGKPVKRQDDVRIGNFGKKTPEIRFRGEFMPWSVDLDIEYNARMLSFQGLLRLIQYAGKTQGVGEMRPSAPLKPNNFGQFQIAMKEEA